MSLGLGIFLLVLGGVLAFGVRNQWSAFDVTVIGYVLMAGGALAIILYFIASRQRRRPTTGGPTDQRNVPPAT